MDTDVHGRYFSSFFGLRPRGRVNHEIVGDVLEPLDSRRRRQFDALALEGPFVENRTTGTCSPGRHDDDDAIVVINFQQLLGFGPGYRFDIWMWV